MKKFFKKLLSVAGPALIGVLGFTGCDFPFIPRTEYGTPYGEFKVDLEVKDESGKPLKDITVSPIVLHAPNYDIQREELEKISTDASGKASRTYDHWWVDDKVRVIFEDPGNVFAKDSADFTPVQTKNGDKHWYVGEKTVSGTKTMKKLL